MMISQQKPLSARYHYDALDRVASRRQLDFDARQRFYCEGRLVTEIQSEDWQSVIQYGDQLLAQHQQKDVLFDSTLLAIDMQRSVLSAVKAKHARSTAYAPYGHRPCESGLSSLLGFNGQEPEALTGHYLLGNGYRAFNPVLMRFNSPDDLSPFGRGGLNPYAYCSADPINRSDSSGRISMFLKAATREMSKLLGYKVKPIQNQKNLSVGIGVFEDVHKKGTRITFMGHGSGLPGEHLLAAGNDVFVDAKGLFSLAKKNNINVESYDSVRLLICHSAEPGVNTSGKAVSAFGQQFSDILGRPVKAFFGEVGGKANRVSIEGADVGSSYIDYFGVFKETATIEKFGGKNPYRSIRFQPQEFNHLNSTIRV